MDKPICVDTEIVGPFRNGIAMAVLLAMVLVAALDCGVPVSVLRRAVCVALAALGVGLGGCVPRMQRPKRNDESGNVVAILVFGYAYFATGWFLFRWVFDDWGVAFEVAYATAWSAAVGGCVGVVLLTLVRGTTRELLVDVGLLDPELWAIPREDELGEWLPAEAEEPDSRNDCGWPRSAEASAVGSIPFFLADLDCARQPDEPEVPAGHRDGHPAGSDRPLGALGQEYPGPPESEEATSCRSSAGSADRH